jgi:hypothetical protein
MRQRRELRLACEFSTLGRISVRSVGQQTGDRRKEALLAREEQSAALFRAAVRPSALRKGSLAYALMSSRRSAVNGSGGSVAPGRWPWAFALRLLFANPFENRVTFVDRTVGGLSSS